MGENGFNYYTLRLYTFSRQRIRRGYRQSRPHTQGFLFPAPGRPVFTSIIWRSGARMSVPLAR